MIQGPSVSAMGARWRGFEPRVALALLLAGALMVCHGILGASHVLAHGQTQGQTHGTTAVAGVSATDERPHEPKGVAKAASPDAAHGKHHGAAVVAQPDAGDSGATHEAPLLGAAEYFAVLLALAGTALLAALFVSARTPPARQTWPIPAPRYGPGFRHPARGPSPPLLQVFRL